MLAVLFYSFFFNSCSYFVDLFALEGRLMEILLRINENSLGQISIAGVSRKKRVFYRRQKFPQKMQPQIHVVGCIFITLF